MTHREQLQQVCSLRPSFLCEEPNSDSDRSFRDYTSVQYFGHVLEKSSYGPSQCPSDARDRDVGQSSWCQGSPQPLLKAVHFWLWASRARRRDFQFLLIG